MRECSECGMRIEEDLAFCPKCDASLTQQGPEFLVFNCKKHEHADDAVFAAEQEIHKARKQGTRYLKIIHGYGSSGRGGIIRERVREKIYTLLTYKEITAYIPGEEYNDSILTKRQREDLRHDHDKGARNPGITLIVLNS